MSVQYVVDVFHLPPPDQSVMSHQRFNKPPWLKTEESPLQPLLLKLLRSEFGPHITKNHLEGVGILLRRLKQPLAAAATVEQRTQATGPKQGVVVAGLVMQVRPYQPVEGTRHQAFHILYCATAEGEKGKGFMKFLILGQVTYMACQSQHTRSASGSPQSSACQIAHLLCQLCGFMAALLPNAHSHYNSIFVNSMKKQLPGPAPAPDNEKSVHCS